jgi:hypothetical protein
MSGDVRCPACGRPAAGQANCAECNWPLNHSPQAGPLTEAIKQDFQARLRHAQQYQATRDERALLAVLGELAAAVRGEHEAVVVAVGKDCVEVSTIYLDSMGTPLLRDAQRIGWKDIAPRLPSVPGERHAQLAAGGTDLDGNRIAALVRGKLPSKRSAGLFVVAQPAGWRTLEAAAEAAARATRPPSRLMRVAGTGDVPVRSLLSDVLARQAPRSPYYLLTASVDAATGEVRPQPRQLFAAGAALGAERALTLRRMPGDGTDATLAIFAGNGQTGIGRTNWSVATPLTMYRVPVPAGPEFAVRAVLDGPGRVRITEPAGAVAHPDTWKQVFGRIPARVAIAPTPVDLVCAVDLAGDMDTVLRRKGLARDLIQLLSDEYPEEDRLRVAIVICTDHVFGGPLKAQLRRPVTKTSDLGPADEALTCLAATEGVDRRGKYCAPVEDLLYEAERLLKDSAGSGRRPRLVTLAGLPPHPYKQPPSEENACPLRRDWKVSVQKLGAEGARFAVVVDELLRPSDPARAKWNRIGPAGQFALPAAGARQIAESLGLLASEHQRIPLPLTDTREGASQ